MAAVVAGAVTALLVAIAVVEFAFWAVNVVLVASSVDAPPVDAVELVVVAPVVLADAVLTVWVLAVVATGAVVDLAAVTDVDDVVLTIDEEKALVEAALGNAAETAAKTAAVVCDEVMSAVVLAVVLASK